jgi:hypothetical protein
VHIADTDSNADTDRESDGNAYSIPDGDSE